MSDESETDRIEEMFEEIKHRLDDNEDLEPIDPWEAFELWLKQLDQAESTVGSYRYRVKPFPRFCSENDIDALDQVTTRHIKEYEASRRSNVTRQTANNQLGTLRQFLSYCEDLNAISEDVVVALDVPTLKKEDRVNTEKLISERAERILDNLEKFRHASRDHVIFLLLWRTTVRIGTLHSLDVEDLYLNTEDEDRLRTYLTNEGYQEGVVEKILNEAELPFIFPRHRPDQGTRLKNKADGERVINITDWVAEVVEDYLRVDRADVADEYGRRPLLSTRKGGARLTKSGIRSTTYLLTQPCEFGAPCPHGREKEECEAREHGHGAKCPSSKSPHKLRTGSITWHRDRGWPMSDLSDKANAGEELIREVYDQPEKLVRGASRRNHLEKLDENDQNEDS